MVAIVGKGGGECVATRQRRPWFMVGMVSRVLNVLVLGVGVVGGCCVGFVCGGGWVAFWREKKRIGGRYDDSTRLLSLHVDANGGQSVPHPNPINRLVTIDHDCLG